MSKVNFLTPEIVADVVTDCLGAVKVLCIIGPSGTGKTMSLKRWSAMTPEAGGIRVAYFDNHTVMVSGKTEVAFDGKVKGVSPGHYPMFDLKGVDVVIIDEALQNREIVARLFVHVELEKGPFTHRLLVLPVQQERALDLLEIPRSAMRLYSVEGVQL